MNDPEYARVFFSVCKDMAIVEEYVYLVDGTVVFRCKSVCGVWPSLSLAARVDKRPEEKESDSRGGSTFLFSCRLKASIRESIAA